MQEMEENIKRKLKSPQWIYKDNENKLYLWVKDRISLKKKVKFKSKEDSIDAEKAFNKIQHLLWIKPCRK